ncbi:hypothetical protein B0H63DRAFT_565698 [Podospora didyma]|uniref:Protein kinase domain-containing protein n=1 Tax=Podospora didyma TaxID=330526 RepID=A0AAE0N392_9PEZI|nr:hypothetical protein B0H63DRAFT_565698 [Podospora didyma]
MQVREPSHQTLSLPMPGLKVPYPACLMTLTAVEKPGGWLANRLRRALSTKPDEKKAIGAGLTENDALRPAKQLPSPRQDVIPALAEQVSGQDVPPTPAIPTPQVQTPAVQTPAAQSPAGQTPTVLALFTFQVGPLRLEEWAPDKIYNVERKLFVARDDQIPVPAEANEIFKRDIEVRLRNDLKKIQRMVESRAIHGFRQPSHWIFEFDPFIRMSGEASGGKNGQVTLSPTIWIRCSKHNQKQVKKALKDPFLNWLKSTPFGAVQVGDAAILLVNPSQQDDAVDGRVEFSEHGIPLSASLVLFVHLEHVTSSVTSVNGLMCRATVTNRNGMVLTQKYSTIGGVIYVCGRRFALTTAHGMLDALWNSLQSGVANSEDEWEVGYENESSTSGGSDHNGDSDDEISDTSSESYTCYEAYRLKQLTPLDTSLNKTDWLPADMAVVSEFLGLSLKVHYGHHDERPISYASGLLPWDFALVELGRAFDTQTNMYGDGVELTVIERRVEVEPGEVTLILARGSVAKGTLLVASGSLSILGNVMETRVICLDQPLGPGSSGAWVVRGPALCGMIVAGNESEPIAHMVSATSLLHSIREATSASIFDISLLPGPNNSPPYTQQYEQVDALPGRNEPSGLVLHGDNETTPKDILTREMSDEDLHDVGKSIPVVKRTPSFASLDTIRGREIPTLLPLGSTHSPLLYEESEAETMSISDFTYDSESRRTSIATRLTLYEDSEEDTKSISGLSYDFGHTHRASGGALASFDQEELPAMMELPESRAEVEDFGSRYRVPFEVQKLSDLKLRTRLLKAIVKASDKSGHKGFLPKAQLSRLLTKEAVEQELRDCEESVRSRMRDGRIFKQFTSADDIAAFAERIRGSGLQTWPVQHLSGSSTAKNLSKDFSETPAIMSFQKILAILLLIERPSRIRSFVEHGICDADLPLIRVLIKGSRTQFILRRGRNWDLRRRGDLTTPLPCFDDWRNTALKEFEECQWTMVPPFFRRGQGGMALHYILPPKVILPFTEMDKMGEPGCFGQVYAVKIHPDQHAFHVTSNTNPLFTVKELFTKDRADFKRKIDVLNRFSGNTHMHLISLLATYEQQNTYFLICLWADFNLLGYWKEKNPEPFKDQETAYWLLEQCQGLADGLASVNRYYEPVEDSISLLGRQTSLLPEHGSSAGIHRPPVVGEGTPAHDKPVLFGRYCNIKPQNILWFPDTSGQNGNGTLKITDFGIADFSTMEGGVYPLGPVVPNSLTYRPPETDIPGAVISPSSDIWALGCICLEFVAWFIDGWKCVEEFQDRRMAPDGAVAGFKTDTFFAVELNKDTGEPRAVVKTAVTEFIVELESQPSCAQFESLLILIWEEMLVVDGRSSPANIAAKLARLVEGHLRPAKAKSYLTLPIFP